MILSLPVRQNAFAEFLTILLIFLFVCVLTYASTRFIANYQKEKLSNTNIEVIESFRIAPNKYVQIIRVGEKYMAVAISKDTITMLTEIPEEQLEILETDVSSKPAIFKDMFQKAMKHTANKHSDEELKEEKQADRNE